MVYFSTWFFFVVLFRKKVKKNTESLMNTYYNEPYERKSDELQDHCWLRFLFKFLIRRKRKCLWSELCFVSFFCCCSSNGLFSFGFLIKDLNLYIVIRLRQWKAHTKMCCFFFFEYKKYVCFFIPCFPFKVKCIKIAKYFVFVAFHALI